MLSARAASWRLSLGCLLALTPATALAVTATAGPASADSVRNAEQWVLDAVDAPAAWPVSQGQGVVVAVIDSGVKPDVSDLTGSVITGPDYSGVHTPPSNPNWGMHGTWMASLIAGHGHGAGSGITGVAPKATVLSIRVLPDKKDPAHAQYEREPPSSGQQALAKAIRYAVAHRVSVISMSLGYGSASRVVRKALQTALRRKIVVVASAGNSGDSATRQRLAHAAYSFPADYPGVLGVAAVSRAGRPAYFSSDNLSVQVAAPGLQVPAQGNNGQYWLVDGTSPACALTSGVAALIKSVYPHMSPALVVQAITTSAQHPPGGYNDQVGFGAVDAAAALKAAARLAGRGPASHGIRTSSHFGGGAAAIPPPPVKPRGPGQLVLFCLLAVACLAMTAAAASRLAVTRAHRADPNGPADPGLAAVRPASGPPAVPGPDGSGRYGSGPDPSGPDGADGTALTDPDGQDGGAPETSPPDASAASAPEASATGVSSPDASAASAPDASALPGRHAAPRERGIIWPRNRDAATGGPEIPPGLPRGAGE
jgi:Subtilase family